jgi:hypothetical protein
MSKTYHGKYQVQNPTKYKGNYKEVYFRSLWEMKVMKFLDHHPKIKYWSSEELVVPYISPVDNKQHRYFIDFVYCNDRDEVFAIEVKPKAQTIEPKKTTKKDSSRYLTEVKTYLVNQAKWNYATEYCNKRKWIFKVWTEDTLKKLGIKL